MRLYHRWKCPWCAAARQGLENVEADVELVEVPYPREERDELASVSGQRRVPVLVDGEAVVIGSRQVVRHAYATRGGEFFERSVAELDAEITALEDAPDGDYCEPPPRSGDG